jgi:hypothetical protein
MSNPKLHWNLIFVSAPLVPTFTRALAAIHKRMSNPKPH